MECPDQDKEGRKERSYLRCTFMKEYMLYIRNKKDAKEALSKDQHLAFVKQCEVYIGQLKAGHKLIAAQPILREGVVLSKSGQIWIERDIRADAETQVGYYHIRANDLQEAIQMARENPEFAYVPSASIEVRPIKTLEPETGFIYPEGSQQV